MDKATAIEQDTEDTTNVVPFKAITGGRGGSGNWLATMNIGTVFASRKRDGKDRISLDRWIITGQGDFTTELFSNLNMEMYVLVDTKEFSINMELVEIIHEVLTTNGNSV